MSNIVGANFKKYVADQIKIRQSRLGQFEPDNTTLSWANSKTAYVALASSVDIKNTPIYETTISVEISAPDISAPVEGNAADLNQSVADAGGANEVLNNQDRLITDPTRWTAQLKANLEIRFLPQLVADIPDDQRRGGGGVYSQWTQEMYDDFRTNSDDLGNSMGNLTAEGFARVFENAINRAGTWNKLIYSLVEAIKTTGRFNQVKAAFKKYFPSYFGGDLIAALEDEWSITIRTDEEGFLIIKAGSYENELFPSQDVESPTLPFPFNLNIDGQLKTFNSPYKKASAYITTNLGFRPNVNVAQQALNEASRFAVADQIAKQTPQSIQTGLQIAQNLYPKIERPKPTEAVVTTTSKQIGETNEGTKRLQSLGLSTAYLGNGVAKNLVLTNGTTKVENDGTRTYKAGVADNLSVFNDYAYGFGGDQDWGLVAMPGLMGVDVKSKNMGSLREATVQIRANSEKQFSLIDILYCRIGYTMFLEWGNSLFINNSNQYVNNPIQGGVQSLIPTFLNPGKDACFDTNTGLQKKIETNREKSGGNYDAFLGRVANFSWEFSADGYYTVTLKLISIGDIIESLKIDETVSDINISNIQPPVQAQPSANSALESFLAVAATPIGNTSVDLNLIADTGIEYNLNITKNKLVADSSYSEAGIGTSLQVVSQQTGGEYSAELKYDRSKTNSSGKVISARAIMGPEVYHYIRFGDILDFIKTKLLIYNPACDKRPIIDIDTDINSNLCYATPYNLSADPSKVMVRSGLIDTDILRGWAAQFNEEGERNWPHPLRHNSIFSSNFADGGINKIEIFKTTEATFEGKKLSYAGYIMNIYFEYRYLLDTVQSKRDKTTGNVSLLDFINELLSTANECLGGINKLTTRIVDDNRLQIYDQNPIYGTQSPAPKTSIFNLYGIRSNEGSFVRNFNIQTELTNEFATQVTIGAQAQGSKDTTDALALSNWNYGLIDRIIPQKLSSAEFDKPKTPSTYESIINVRNQLMLLWCAYAEGTKFTNIARPDLTENQISDFEKYLETQSGILEANEAQDFDLDDANITEKKGYYFKHFPTKRYKEFVKLQKDLFALLHINSDYNSNQQGMLPINISVEIDGLAGIRIYDQLPIDTRFIPNYYPQTLYWIIKGVSHSIVDNKWMTKLETIAVPKIPDLPAGSSSTKSTKIKDKPYEDIPLNDINPVTKEEFPPETSGTDGGSGGGGTGGGGTGQTGGGTQGYDAPHTNPTTARQKELKQEFLSTVEGFTQPTSIAWVPLIDSNTATSRKISLTSLPQAGRYDRNHYGVDIACPVGTQVLAPEDGVWVVQRGETNPSSTAGTYGYIKSQQPDGRYFYHQMMHLSKIILTSGTTVKAGDVVALSGGAEGDPKSGRSSGPHLHYELKVNDPNARKFYSVVDWINNHNPAPGSQLLSGTGVSGNAGGSSSPSPSPSSGPSSSSSSSNESIDAYYRIARKLKNIFNKVDGQGPGGGPLLKFVKSTDDETKALETFKNWFSTNAEVKADYAKLDEITKRKFDLALRDLEDQIDDYFKNDVIFKAALSQEAIIVQPSKIFP